MLELLADDALRGQAEAGKKARVRHGSAERAALRSRHDFRPQDQAQADGAQAAQPAGRPCLQRKAGAHRRSTSAERRAAKQALAKALRKGDA